MKSMGQLAGDRALTSRRAGGFSLVELLISISALSLGIVAAYSAQLSATNLGMFARESDVATFAASSAIDMVTARAFAEMIDPDPVMGSIDTDELAAMQPPYDPRGHATYAAAPSTYPDAPMIAYVGDDPPLYNKVLDYGARIWEPVQKDQVKVDPATGLSYKLYPFGALQTPKILVWFEPRPIKLNGGSGTYESPIIKNNSLGYPKLMPFLKDKQDESSAQPTTVVASVAWYPVHVEHGTSENSIYNPLVLFTPPSDGSSTFSSTEITTLKSRRQLLKDKGVRILTTRTVVKQ